MTIPTLDELPDLLTQWSTDRGRLGAFVRGVRFDPHEAAKLSWSLAISLLREPGEKWEDTLERSEENPEFREQARTLVGHLLRFNAAIWRRAA